MATPWIYTSWETLLAQGGIVSNPALYTGSSSCSVNTQQQSIDSRPPVQHRLQHLLSCCWTSDAVFYLGRPSSVYCLCRCCARWQHPSVVALISWWELFSAQKCYGLSVVLLKRWPPVLQTNFKDAEVCVTGLRWLVVSELEEWQRRSKRAVAVVEENQDKVTVASCSHAEGSQEESASEIKAYLLICLKRSSVFKTQLKRIQYEAPGLSTHSDQCSVHLQDSIPLFHSRPLWPVLLQVGRTDWRLQLQGGHGGPLQQRKDLPKAGQSPGQGLLSLLLLPAFQTLSILGSLFGKVLLFAMSGMVNDALIITPDGQFIRTTG